jgi:hypothetical protein
MGGFLLYVNDEPRATLTPDELRCFVRDGSVDMPAVAEADIEDRSKGDVLSKGIAILQIAWFVLQIAARYAQHLPIALLEIDTLAVAALTSIVYGWWWKKPKDAGRPYPIYWKNTYPEPRNLHYEYVIDIFLAATRLIPPCNSRSNAKLDAGGSYVMKILYPFATLMGVDPMISPGAVRSRRVPSLGGFAETHGGIVLLAGCFSGMMFGAIHCVGWNYFLQKPTEQVLWHVASLAILCAPIPSLIYYCFMIPKWLSKLDVDGFFSFVMLLAGFAYIAARLTLIGLIFLSFQSLPPGVYDTVTWTMFIPHF